MTDYADGALAPWFGQARDIQMIQLPEGMTSVGDYAFMGCEGVTSIVIPESVTEIGECAFSQCRSLIFVDLGNNLQIIGEGAFQECESLPWINIPASVTEIRAKAFYRCYSMIAGNTPETVKVLGESVFSYCTDMVRAVINAPIEELPSWTFYGCKSLSDVSLAPEIVSVGDYAFLFCENLSGIYTQGGKLETVHALEESLYNKDGSPKKGLLKAYDMSAYSMVEIDDGQIFTQIKMVSDSSVIVLIKLTTDYANGETEPSVETKAVIFSSSGWEKLSEISTEIVKYCKLPLISIEVYQSEDTLESEWIEFFVAKPVAMRIAAKTGYFWEIDMSNTTLGSFSGQYDLTEMAAKTMAEKVAIEAMLSEMDDEQSFEVEDTSDSESGVVFEPYDSDSVQNSLGESHLVDEEGTTYYVTKRSSKWGITGKQFAVYVGLWIASAVLIVAVIMLSMNQRKKSKEQYEELVKQGKAEDAVAKEALQVELLKDILDKKTDNQSF